MDPFTSWYQTDIDGPAKLLWLRIWQTQQELESMKVQESTTNTIESTCEIEQQFANGFLNPQHQIAMMFNGKMAPEKINNNRRLKTDQRLANKRTIGHNNRPAANNGGCPWRQVQFPYQKGVMG